MVGLAVHLLETVRLVEDGFERYGNQTWKLGWEGLLVAVKRESCQLKVMRINLAASA